MTNKRKNVCVVVLGDIGRSPRMQYHSISLAEQGFIVDIVGYGETQPLQTIKSNPQIYTHYLVPFPNMKYIPRLLNYVLKTVWQVVTLLFMLVIIRKPDVILVQNPPAIPSLLVCWFYSLLVRAKLLIDWHNYAHTIMALSVGKRNILVRLTETIEFFIGSKASNICVTKAMQRDLKERDVVADVLYDRPPDMFRSISIQEKHDFLLRLGNNLPQFLCNDGGTIFTYVDDLCNVNLKENRPGFVISSTSWTEDEDFSILLSALQVYEKHCEDSSVENFDFPKLICVITGKGPLKEYYRNIIEKMDWKYVSIILPWLESSDYPYLLASADLGVCLHTSSSGLDLPMKVVDMFGCGLPVCAYDFNCLDELVQHEVNSWKFGNTKELATQIMAWFQKFPNNIQRNEIEKKFKSQLEEFQNVRWEENWNRNVLPLIK